MSVWGMRTGCRLMELKVCGKMRALCTLVELTMVCIPRAPKEWCSRLVYE